MLPDSGFELVGDGALGHRRRLLRGAADGTRAEKGADGYTMIGTVPPSALQAEPVT